MKIIKNTITIIIISILLVTCGGSNPKISHVVVKSDRLGILLDSKDSSILSDFSDIFYEKQEEPNAGPEFKYLIDITIGSVTTRWQYSKDGFIRNYEESASMIYHLRDTATFNRLTKID